MSVPLHRQNTRTFCGAACIQMIRAAAGDAASGIAQRDVFAGAEQGNVLAACPNPDCRKKPCADDKVTLAYNTPPNGHWEMCPGGLYRSLKSVPSLEKKYELVMPQTEGDMVQRMVTSIRAGFPCVALMDSGNHWVVIHGARRLAGREWALDVRDPWPAIGDEQYGHDHVSCDGLEKSAEHYLIFSEGMRYRLGPTRQGAYWRNTYALIASIPRESPGIPGEKPPPALRGAVPVNAAELAKKGAKEGFKRAKALEWPPFKDKPVEGIETGNMIEMLFEFWCGRDGCVKGRQCFLVELIDKARPQGSESVLALTLVEVSSSKPDVWEIQAPAGGKSWLPKPGSAERIVNEALLARRLARANQPGLAPDGLEWLEQLGGVPAPAVKVEYYWRSNEESRSPFHPLVRVSKDAKAACIGPEGTISSVP